MPEPFTKTVEAVLASGSGTTSKERFGESVRIRRPLRFEETSYRFHLLRRFPYILFCKELIDRVHILAFAHARRRPGYWLDRAKA